MTSRLRGAEAVEEPLANPLVEFEGRVVGLVALRGDLHQAAQKDFGEVEVVRGWPPRALDEPDDGHRQGSNRQRRSQFLRDLRRVSGEADDALFRRQLHTRGSRGGRVEGSGFDPVGRGACSGTGEHPGPARQRGVVEPEDGRGNRVVLRGVVGCGKLGLEEGRGDPRRGARTSTAEEKPRPVWRQNGRGRVWRIATGWVRPQVAISLRARLSREGAAAQSEAMRIRRRPAGSRSTLGS